MSKKKIIFNIKIYRKLANNYIKSNDTEDLNALRSYLDACNYRMPKPKYFYDINNVKTHKYLEGTYNFNEHLNIITYKEYLNKSFNPYYEVN